MIIRSALLIIFYAYIETKVVDDLLHDVGFKFKLQCRSAFDSIEFYI